MADVCPLSVPAILTTGQSCVVDIRQYIDLEGQD